MGYKEIAVSLRVGGADVMNEVSKVTAYAGAYSVTTQQVVGNDGVPMAVTEPVPHGNDSMLMTDAAQEDWRRWWQEISATATNRLSEYLVNAQLSQECRVLSAGSEKSERSEKSEVVYEAQLSMPGNFQVVMAKQAEAALFWYFVYMLVSRWYGFVNKQEEEKYAVYAAAKMDEVLVALSKRVRPSRR